ncbi:MAG: pyridoxine 5'-phosphate synthase [Gammaproteobacteria bacterium]|nr:pyridoxine 5'-phosphate synthase [Gammaproteobacteria bacterium]
MEATRYVRLGVNVDHTATLRQQRGTRYPDPVAAAAVVELAGADQVTVHLREDRRHIQDRDLRILRETIQTRLNLEMADTAEMRRIALETRPGTVTLVPEKREEQTTEGGLDVVTHRGELAAHVPQLVDAGIEVSLFVDPDPAQIDASRAVGAQAVELHTGDYCNAASAPERARELERLQKAATHAAQAGLVVVGGHGLDYVNVGPVAAIPEMEELNIGHSIIARAIFVGLDQAVREMIALLRR